MSLIELIVEEILSKHILISNDNPELFIYNKLKLREVLEKYLKQSEKIEPIYNHCDRCKINYTGIICPKCEQD